METTFFAPDIECDGCAASIQKALGGQPGVQAITVVVPEKTITVQFDPQQISQSALMERLTEIGFPPQTR